MLSGRFRVCQHKGIAELFWEVRDYEKPFDNFDYCSGKYS